MKHLYPKKLINGLLALAVIFTTMDPAQAQCPAGSTSNTAGSYTNGQKICISASFSGSITLHNGATLYVVNGGNFTGDIDAKSGSSIIVQTGGIFNPNNANNFAGAITVNQNGTAILGTGNISFSNGFAMSNSGKLTWAKSFSTNAAMTLTNTACGAMTFSQSVNLSNSSSLINNGVLVLQSSLTTSSGTTIDNRGSITVNGDLSISGLYKNQWKSVFKGSNNTFNSGDSVINLYTMTFTSGVIGAPKLRNDGLFWIKGSFTYNNGGTAVMKASNAIFRVDGAMMNNTTIYGYGNNLYVGGGFSNNGTVRGNNSSQQLRVNQNPSGGAQSFLNVASYTPQDTTSFAGGNGNPATCNALLPMTVTSLKGMITDNGILLSWATTSELNGKKFVVEYSTDGLSYNVAGEVAAKGNSNGRLEYSYLFTKNTNSTVYFRLNMVDLDGREEYSNTVMVKAGATQTMTVGVYPNPFTEKLDIALRISKSTQVAIKIIDMNGRQAKSQLFNGQSGSNKFTLTGLSALQPGLYLVEVTAGEEKWIQKVIR